VTVFAGESPHCIVDQLSRTPESLANTFAHQLQAMLHHKLVRAFDAILVIGPEHARVFTDAGWDRDRILFELHMRLATPIDELVRGASGIAEGVPEAIAEQVRATAGPDVALPKFTPTGLLLAYAGSGAGLFSMLIAGWANGAVGSTPVTRAVRY